MQTALTRRNRLRYHPDWLENQGREEPVEVDENAEYPIATGLQLDIPTQSSRIIKFAIDCNGRRRSRSCRRG